MPFLVELEKREDGSYVPGKQLRASDFADGMGENNNPEWKTVAWDETRDQLVVPRGSIGFRWGQESGEEGRGNLEPGDFAGAEIKRLLPRPANNNDAAKAASPSSSPENQTSNLRHGPHSY